MGGMAVTLHFIGGMFQGMMAAEIPMRFRVSWASVGDFCGHCPGDGADFRVDSSQAGHTGDGPGGHPAKSGYPQPGQGCPGVLPDGPPLRTGGILAKKYFRRSRRRPGYHCVPGAEFGPFYFCQLLLHVPHQHGG